MATDFKNLKSEFFTDCRIAKSGDKRGLCAIFKDKAYNLKNGRRMLETVYTEEILTARVMAARDRGESRPMEEAALVALQVKKDKQVQRKAAKQARKHIRAPQ